MSNLRIIQIGLPWDYHIFDEQMQKFVRDGLEKGRETMKEAGFNGYSTFDVTPEEGLGNLKKFLRETHVDGIVIGFGIRGTKELTPFFELLINEIHQNAPHVKFMFNTSPNTAVDAVKRQFPSK